MDALPGQLITVPGIADESKHKVIKAAIGGFGLMLVLLGCPFYFGAMP